MSSDLELLRTLKASRDELNAKIDLLYSDYQLPPHQFITAEERLRQQVTDIKKQICSLQHQISTIEIAIIANRERSDKSRVMANIQAHEAKRDELNKRIKAIENSSKLARLEALRAELAALEKECS